MSSTNDNDFSSVFIAIDRPSAASRSVQMRACASASTRAMEVGAESLRREIALERGKPRRKLRGVVRVELDAEQRRRISLDEALPQRVKLRTSLPCD